MEIIICILIVIFLILGYIFYKKRRVKKFRKTVLIDDKCHFYIDGEKYTGIIVAIRNDGVIIQYEEKYKFVEFKNIYP